MLPRLFLIVLLALVSGLSRAECPPHPFTDPAKVKLEGDSVLIVTHASSLFDGRVSAKRGIDEAVRFARNEGIPIVYLQDDSPGKYYYMEDCNPAYWVYSGGGEVTFDVEPENVYIVGGHLEQCMSTTVHDVIYNWAKKPPRNRSITYFMDGIYSNGKLVDPSDPFYGDFDKFMGVVTYGRSGGEHWPKLTLLETMGVIRREDHQMEYLMQALPHWERTFSPEYRIELQLDDSVKKVLQAAPGWKPPTILFRFIDSALIFSESRPSP